MPVNPRFWLLHRVLKGMLTTRLWVVNLLTLAAVAYFLADGASQVIAMEIMERLPTPERRPKTLSPTLQRNRRSAPTTKNGDDILNRNIFDSSLGPISRVAASEDSELQEQADAVASAVEPCDQKNLRVVATVVSDANAAWSFAALADGRQTRLRRVGDAIGNWVVAGIGWRHMLLENDSGYCYVDLFGETNLEKNKAIRARKGSKAGFKNGVKVLGPHKRLVERRVIEKALYNPVRLLKGTKMRPRKKNGQIVGYQLQRMPRSSPMAKLGLKRRDVINQIDGIDINSMNEVYKAYGRLRNANEIKFSVTRRGKPVELRAVVR